MPREVLKDTRTDEWCTPSEIVALVLNQWPAGIDLDPCGHPESLATKAAAQSFDIRQGVDGLLAPWPAGARVYCNPPYRRGQVKRWSGKCAAHAAAGGECLLLVNAQVGAEYARRMIWPNIAAACLLSPRICFSRDGIAMPTMNLMDSVLFYFAPDDSERAARVQAFVDTWKARGTIITVLAAQVDTPKPAANTAATDATVAIATDAMENAA